MAIGERIRWFRNRLDMTQKELGLKVGFGEHTADARIRQYETGIRNPKADVVKDLARIFDVAEETLTVPDIDTYIGLMHTLFALEDMYGLTITKLDGQVCLKQDLNHPNYSLSLANDLLTWYEEKNKLVTGCIRTEEYDQWRYCYPREKTIYQQWELDKKQKGELENE